MGCTCRQVLELQPEWDVVSPSLPYSEAVQQRTCSNRNSCNKCFRSHTRLTGCVLFSHYFGTYAWFGGVDITATNGWIITEGE